MPALFAPPPPSPAIDSLADGLVVRLSVTARCQLRCVYCLPERGCACSPGQPATELPRAALVRLVSLLHRAHGVRRVRFTGGEPLLRRDLPELVAAIAALGIPELALTTNAQLLAPRAAVLRAAGLQRINISLDSLRPETFARVSRGGVLAHTLEGIHAAQSTGLGPVKLNMVVLRGVNDTEVADLLHFALRTGCHVRFLELMPIGVAAPDFAERFVCAEEIRHRLDEADFAWTPMPWALGETSRDWRVRDGDGRETICGFIAPTTEPFCEGCRRLRLTAEGRLHGCLARSSEHDLTPLLAAPDDAATRQQLTETLAAALAQKHGERFSGGVASMASVGG
jgi:cyclic pyranopterin phosphate synthase